jgi:glutamine synthetase
MIRAAASSRSWAISSSPGMLRHAKAICAVTCPTVNSYKRLIRKGSVWVYLGTGVCLLRQQQPHQHAAHSPSGGAGGMPGCGHSTNLYLGAAMILAAGLEGIEQGLDPGDPHTENMYTYTLPELDAMGIELLPRTLQAAIDAFERDPLSERP